MRGSLSRVPCHFVLRLSPKSYIPLSCVLCLLSLVQGVNHHARVQFRIKPFAYLAKYLTLLGLRLAAFDFFLNKMTFFALFLV